MTVQLLNNPPINQTNPIKNDNIYQNQIPQGIAPIVQAGYGMQANSMSSSVPPPVGCGSNLNVSA